ncbi:MAG TPA: sigma-70 family RNA polymerase sigma factor [Planctomycetota bacterium]|nr:sigma-70 family RNA polymerase sigma factor [Planctomycetota bacterium]
MNGSSWTGDGVFESQSSQALVERLKASTAKRSPGFQEAFRKLERLYRHRIRRLAVHLIGPELRKRLGEDDAVSMAWGRAFKELGSFEYRHKRSFYRWLAKQLKRVILDEARKAETPDGGGDTDWGEIAAPNREGDAFCIAAKEEVARALESTLVKVPLLYREVLRAVHVEGLDRKAAAERFGRLPNTLTHQLKRGLERWRDVIERKYGAGAFEDLVGDDS